MPIHHLHLHPCELYPLFVLSPIGEQADQPLLAKTVNEGSLDSGITLLLRRRSTKLSTLTHIPVLWPIHFEICLVRAAYRNLHNPFFITIKDTGEQ